MCMGLLVANLAWAERADRTQPVQLEADKVSLDDAKKTAVYQGHVIMNQGTLTIKADRIDVNQDGQGMTSGVATGNLAYFRQKMEGSDQYMEAWAKRAEYDARTGILKLIGTAHLKRGEDDLRGPLIVYDTQTERYRAEGNGEPGGTGRVRAVIQPSTRNDAPEAKP